jgi:Flp pilus assembly protein TadG
MTARRLASWVQRRCRRLATDQRGVSAIEFSLLMPLMLTMYFGSLEVTDAISADRQVTLVASTVADITSEYSSVASTDISNIMSAASAVLSPFPVANAKVTLSSVVIDQNGNAYVDWSTTLNGTAIPYGQNVTTQIPAALLTGGPTSVIWGQTSYAYKPVIGYVVTGTLNMSNQIFMRPRLSSCVQYNGAYCTSGTINAP